MEKPGKYTTEKLAEYILDLRAEDIPEATVETVQRCVLDLIASALAGAQAEAALIARGSVQRLGGPGMADIWFGGGRRPATCAAFPNSAAASAMDLDDGHRAAAGIRGRPSSRPCWRWPRRFRPDGPKSWRPWWPATK